MNPATEPPPQPPRSSFSCDRHQNENFTGFCPSCLCERLTTLDQSAIIPSSSSRRNSTSSSSTAAAAIRSIFKAPYKPPPPPELRRTKSFSAAKHDGLGIPAAVFEPQRKSCDVRGRNTLSSLFSIHDENKPRVSYSQQQNGVVLETNREDEEEEECHEISEVRVPENDVVVVEEGEDVIIVKGLENDVVVEEEAVKKIEEKEKLILKDLKPMKDYLEDEDYLDLDSQIKKRSRSNFWSAASVLTKKWHKWRRKQKDRVASGTNGVILSSTLPVEKPITRQYRETQSEIADYGFGRRSCDTDPRFSLDVGRVSFDDPRYSFDEPRASWDGYLIGRTFPRLPPMVEDAPLVVHVARCDSLIPVENNDSVVPGGSVQTREYYLDSSSKRRKSLDRSNSNSIRRMAASVVAELDETTKVKSGSVDGSNGVMIDPPRASNSNSSLRDDSSETFELKDRDNVVVPKEVKKARKWRWKIWGFGFGLIHRRSKEDDEDQCSIVSGVGRSYSESWEHCSNNNNNNNNNNNGGNRKVFRSNSSVSWRSSSLRKSNPNNINGLWEWEWEWEE